jgi:hypothetical protein
VCVCCVASQFQNESSQISFGKFGALKSQNEQEESQTHKKGRTHTYCSDEGRKENAMTLSTTTPAPPAPAQHKEYRTHSLHNSSLLPKREVWALSPLSCPGKRCSAMSLTIPVTVLFSAVQIPCVSSIGTSLRLRIHHDAHHLLRANRQNEPCVGISKRSTTPVEANGDSTYVDAAFEDMLNAIFNAPNLVEYREKFPS